ncbi:hypothetical protein DY000_02063220 [Brassica cretica]|uniref:Uncharacterized protein n=1 Tax=Brassica cretica TaxID=69181 RepID=A0ABQ7AUE6_BRACR|nr:hypothetical protein DY000_02063220 [Brassica cretica]
MISSLATVLDMADTTEQEKAVSCLLILFNEEKKKDISCSGFVGIRTRACERISASATSFDGLRDPTVLKHFHNRIAAATAAATTGASSTIFSAASSL